MEPTNCGCATEEECEPAEGCPRCGELDIKDDGEFCVQCQVSAAESYEDR